MSYKIIFLDIDGTLTDSSKRITPRTKEALLRANDMGLILAIASGRPEPGLGYCARELELAKRGGYILPFNGGIIKEVSTGRVIASYTLERRAVMTAYNVSKEYGLGIITYKNGEIITERTDEYIQLESRINGMPVRITDSFMDEVNYAPVKCLLTGEPEKALKAEKKLSALLDGCATVFRSEPFFTEVMPDGIDKSAAVIRLTKELGISPSEAIACGDGYNDVSMIRCAGLGVAMANGCDSARAAADYIAPSNDSDGIAGVIEKFVLDGGNYGKSIAI